MRDGSPDCGDHGDPVADEEDEEDDEGIMPPTPLLLKEWVIISLPKRDTGVGPEAERPGRTRSGSLAAFGLLLLLLLLLLPVFPRGRAMDACGSRDERGLSLDCGLRGSFSILRGRAVASGRWCGC